MTEHCNTILGFRRMGVLNDQMLCWELIIDGCYKNGVALATALSLFFFSLYMEDLVGRFRRVVAILYDPKINAYPYSLSHNSSLRLINLNQPQFSFS